MQPGDLERQVEWTLRQLPRPHAPRTLLPRVMAASRAWDRRRWYQRTWFTWPLGWQVASAVVLLSMGGGGLWLSPTIHLAAATALSGMTAFLTTAVPDVGPRTETTVLALQVLWRALVHPVLIYTFVIVALMSLLCAAIAVALNRAVFGKAVNS
jgi:hypothetical protein